MFVLQAYWTSRTSYRQTLWYLPANWRSFIRWLPDQWVIQCYAIGCYKSLYCDLLCLYDSCESMSDQTAPHWTPDIISEFLITCVYIHYRYESHSSRCLDSCAWSWNSQIMGWRGLHLAHGPLIKLRGMSNATFHLQCCRISCESENRSI
jgi:hypothetical protein